jgi:diaminobutyrate-2-oxoglutarate transaminase
MFAFEHSGIVPDVVVMSKAIGGGLPLSVIVYHEKLDRWQPGAHAGTFRGNQLAMVAGSATIAFIRENRIAAHAATMGERLRGHLETVQKRHAWIGDIRGRGLMIGAEIVRADRPSHPGSPPPADGARARNLQIACFERGLIVELGGRHSAVVRFLAPLIVTPEEIDEIAGIFADAAEAVR